MTAKLCGLESIVRLPDNGRREITRIMDMGATGILIPMTNDESQIKKAVEYAKYAPVGKRGISTMRPHTFYRPGPLEEYMKEANEATKVFAQIETAAGVDNAEKILSAEGALKFRLSVYSARFPRSRRGPDGFRRVFSGNMAETLLVYARGV